MAALPPSPALDIAQGRPRPKGLIIPMLADCLHDLAALGPAGGLPTLLGALFLAGLAGGATHCSTMCAPFVLAQASVGMGAGGGVLRRLSGAALAPYHLGRMLGYGALGALAGGTAGGGGPGAG